MHKLCCNPVFIGWVDVTASDKVVLCKLELCGGAVDTVYSLQIQEDFTWDMYVRQEHMAASSPLALLLPTVCSVSEVVELLCQIDNCTICIGNPDDKYSVLIASRKGTFMDSTGK